MPSWANLSKLPAPVMVELMALKRLSVMDWVVASPRRTPDWPAVVENWVSVPTAAVRELKGESAGDVGERVGGGGEEDGVGGVGRTDEDGGVLGGGQG
jgi:hypothetical protein